MGWMPLRITSDSEVTSESEVKKMKEAGSHSLSHARFARGVTMIELMVTLVVSVLLIAMAIPSFDRVFRNGLLVHSANDLSASLSRARAEAIKARRNVRMCPTSNNTSCDASAAWSDGWIMFVDADNNGLPAISELVQVTDALDSRVTLTVPAAFSQWMQFRPTGGVIGNGGNSGNFSLCSGDYHEFSRRVGISATGRVTTTKQPNLCATS